MPPISAVKAAWCGKRIERSCPKPPISTVKAGLGTLAPFSIFWIYTGSGRHRIWWRIDSLKTDVQTVFPGDKLSQPLREYLVWKCQSFDSINH